MNLPTKTIFRPIIGAVVGFFLGATLGMLAGAVAGAIVELLIGEWAITPIGAMAVGSASGLFVSAVIGSAIFGLGEKAFDSNVSPKIGVILNAIMGIPIGLLGGRLSARPFEMLTPMMFVGTIGLLVGMCIGLIDGVIVAVRIPNNQPKLSDDEKRRVADLATFYRERLKR